MGAAIVRLAGAEPELLSLIVVVLDSLALRNHRDDAHRVDENDEEEAAAEGSCRHGALHHDFHREARREQEGNQAGEARRAVSRHHADDQGDGCEAEQHESNPFHGSDRHLSLLVQRQNVAH